MPYKIENLLKTYLHLENYPVRMAEMSHLLPKKPVEYKLRSGLHFWIRPYTTDGSCVVDVTREEEYFKYFKVMPGDNVIDIGANIGSFAVFAAWLQPTARVLAAEPLGENFSFLKKNAESNRLANLELFQVGIMHEAGEIKIYHGTGNAEGSSSIVPGEAVDSSRPEIVPCIPFAELLDKVSQCDFLKIDCEGAEFDFLLPASSSSLRKIRKLVMEYHDFRTDVSHKDLVRKFEGEGFKVIVEPHPTEPKIGMLYAIAA